MSKCLPWTPQQIKDTFGVDVFAETVGKLSYPTNPAIVPALEALCWQRFRNRLLGDYNREYWLQNFNDAVLTAWAWYSRAADKLASAWMTYTDTTTYQDTSANTNSSENITGTEIEKLPAFEIVTNAKYLTDRNKTTGSVDGRNDSSNSGTRTDGLRVEAAMRMVDGLKAANVAFVRELDGLFMNRW